MSKRNPDKPTRISLELKNRIEKNIPKIREARIKNGLEDYNTIDDLKIPEITRMMANTEALNEVFKELMIKPRKRI